MILVKCTVAERCTAHKRYIVCFSSEGEKMLLVVHSSGCGVPIWHLSDILKCHIHSMAEYPSKIIDFD